MAKTSYEFSADHVSENYRFNHSVMEINEYQRYPSGVGYCASHDKLGMSKDYDTPEQAIRMMLLEHGCSAIIVHGKITN